MAGYGSNTNLTMIRGNTESFNIQIQLNGTPVNITGGTLRLTAKWKITDSDGAAVFTVFSPSSGITITNAANGQASIIIARSLTNINAIPYRRVDLPYDLEYTDSNGNVYTVLYGLLTILPNVSQTSP